VRDVSARMAEVTVSARRGELEGGVLALMMEVMVEGIAGGGAGVLKRRRVMGPEWREDAAVMAERVEAGRSGEEEGSDMISVDASRVGMLVAAPPLLRRSCCRPAWMALLRHC